MKKSEKKDKTWFRAKPAPKNYVSYTTQYRERAVVFFILNYVGEIK